MGRHRRRSDSGSGELEMKEKGGAVDSPDAGESFQFDPNFNGVDEGRKCTDCCMTIFFILFFCGMIALFVVALTRSNYKFLYIPTDTRGMMCGYDNSKLSISYDKYIFAQNKSEVNTSSSYLLADSSVNTSNFAPILDLTKQPYLFWVRPGKPGYSRSFCVEKCPDKGLFIDTFTQMIPINGTNTHYGKLKTAKCGISPNSTTPTLENYSAPATEEARFFCPYASMEFSLRCFPTQDALFGENSTSIQSIGASITEALNSVSTVSRAIHDLYLTWYWIAIAVACSLVLSLLYLLLLRFLAACMVYVTCFLAVAGLAALTYMCYNQMNNKYGNAAIAEAYSFGLYSQDLNKKVFQVFFYVLIVIDVIFLLLFIVLWKRIRLAAGVIKVVGRVFGNVPQLFFFPIITFLMEFIWWAYVVGVAIVLFGAGIPYRIYDPETLVDKIDYQYDVLIQGFSIYHFVGFIWITWFLSALGQMTIAGVCADYYFAPEPRKQFMHKHPVTSSLGRALRYHIGSLAIGSLILTIMTLIRIIVEYIDRKTKDQQTDCIKCVVKCMKCCLCCLEKFLKYLNRNAYIMIAVHGYSFWQGCKKAFGLLLRNCLRVAALNSVGDFTLFLGRIFVSGGVTAVALYFFKYQVEGVSFVIVPTCIVFIMAYLASGAFTNVFEMGIDSIFLCYLEDEERNDGSPGHEKRAPEELAQYMESNGPAKD